MMTAENLQMLRGELRRKEPLARFTSWRVGGCADQFYKPADLDDLAFFLSTLPSGEPLMWLGLGSNLLIRDGGVRGTVIALSGALNDMTLLPGGRIRAEAGVACAKLARFAADADLAGAEFLAGIPGTLGGALAMNAGAWGGETWSCVETVETIDHRGRRHLREADEYQVAYRSVTAPGEEWFTAATFRLSPGDGQSGKARIKALLAERAERQPTGVASCGSVFRNPPGDHAGRLVEAAGLKGFSIGGAQVSEKHANFIINTGSATASDLESLIMHVQEQVEARFGVRLEPEVRVVGEPGPARGARS